MRTHRLEICRCWIYCLISQHLIMAVEEDGSSGHVSVVISGAWREGRFVAFKRSTSSRQRH